MADGSRCMVQPWDSPNFDKTKQKARTSKN